MSHDRMVKVTFVVLQVAISTACDISGLFELF